MISTEFAILGSGFAGSLLALILRRLGREVVLVDRGYHPRFAIGESSTPVGNMVLRDLAVRYDLPRLAPLAKYGPWKRTYPDLVRGRKRGFSYFQHRPDSDFVPDSRHSNELLVAASSDEEHSDTHWLRADVDAFLASEAQSAGARLLEGVALEQARHDANTNPAWALAGTDASGKPIEIQTRFVVDATGEACLVGKWLGIANRPEEMQTHSRTIFSHFTGLADFQELLRKRGGQVGDHPFPCDDAAQHQVIDGGWMWVLRFDQGLTSAGFCLDPRRYPLDPSLRPEDEWNYWLGKYPAVAEMFADATLASLPGRIIRSGRMQRFMAQAAGPDWALLPHAAGFVDPLHSSGIAHSLCGVERLARIFETPAAGTWPSALCEYDRIVRAELRMIDRIVASCYATLNSFPAFAACCMLYFAAATTYERRRASHPQALGAFLEANDAAWVETVEDIYQRAVQLGNLSPITDSATRGFVRSVADAIRPWNQVGLFDESVMNMYRHTVAPV